jgi:cytochrome c oxidase cbb3-type subunit 3
LSVQWALLPFPSSSPAEEARFAQPAFLYTMYCVQCHGVNKNGKGINTKDMAVQPRDHSDPKGMGDIPNAELFKAIKEGGLAVNKSVLMPAWGGVLTDSEITEMVAYLRQVCQCGGAVQENSEKGKGQ